MNQKGKLHTKPLERFHEAGARRDVRIEKIRSEGREQLKASYKPCTILIKKRKAMPRRNGVSRRRKVVAGENYVLGEQETLPSFGMGNESSGKLLERT